MAIRLSGMVSGLDTDSVVKALMSAQTYKKTKIESSKQKLEWKQELWADMNTKIYDFYKSSLNKMKMQSTFKTKSASSSDSSKVTATADSNAAEGTYRIKVKSVASAQYVTSGKLGTDKDDNKITANTKLMDLKNGTQFTDTQIQFSAKNGKKTTVLNVDQDTTISDFLTAAQSVGLNATYDTTQNRFFISSASSGENQNFSVQAIKLGAAEVEALKGWRDAIGYEHLSMADKEAVNNIFNGLQLGTKKYEDVETKLEDYLDKARKTRMTSYFEEQIRSQIDIKYGVTRDAEGNVETIAADDGSGGTGVGKQAVIDAYKAEVLKANPGMSDDDALAEAVSRYNNPENAEKNKKVISDLIEKELNDEMKSDYVQGAINTAAATVGVSADIAIKEKEEDISPKWTIRAFGDSGDKDFALLTDTPEQLHINLDGIASSYKDDMVIDETYMADPAHASDALKSLGMQNVTGKENLKEDAAGNDVGMVVVKASNAEITFNGATLSSSNSTLSVNGLTLNILDATKDSELTITVGKDTSAVYDVVKDFISEYNTILKTMNTSYDAKKAKGYDVLTKEMKEQMSDDEVEKWETLVKSSLLRRDDTLGGLITSFRVDMMGTYTASNGKQYSLASLGIMTSKDYTEKGLLHIMGDEDDPLYADSKNKLQKMLDTDPDLAMEIMNGLAGRLYDDLTKKMRSTTYSSTMTFYNDKKMKKEVDQYKKDITTWEKKLADMEDRYYKQFSAMEKAMSNLQSQQNTLSGFFG